MIKLIRKSEKLHNLIGEQEIENDKLYKNSVFNYIVQVDNGVLVFNTLMNIFILTDKENLAFFSEKPFFAPKCADINFFIRNRFLVPQEKDETKLYLEFHELMRTIEDAKQGIERYNILTTTHCNARCFYCFEEGIKQQTMSLEIAKDVTKYIEQTRTKSKPIYLRWFGGEPLINSKVIDKISSIMNEKNIPFYSTISTNGYLIDDETIRKAADVWNVKKIRISMDGLEAEHNKRKNYKSNKDNAFQKTIKNIQRVVDSKITMTVRLNMDSDNIESITELAHYFIEKYEGVVNFNMYVRCLYSEISIDKFNTNREQVDMLLDKKKEIEDYLRQHNIFDYEKLSPIGYRTYFCAANNPNMVTIVPNGNLCSCECHCFDYAHWGNVYNGIINNEEYEVWLKNNLQDRCVSCVFLPQCTPFVSQCPMATCDCKTKFSAVMNDYIDENYKRFCLELKLIEDEIFSIYDY